MSPVSFQVPDFVYIFPTESVGAAVRKFVGVLHNSLAEGLGADNERARFIAEHRCEKLRRGNSPAVHQHCYREFH